MKSKRVHGIPSKKRRNISRSVNPRCTAGCVTGRLHSTRFLQEDLDAVVEVFHSERDAVQVKQVCPVCHGTELLPGRLRSTGLLYFQLKKSKFWTLADNSIKSEGMICKRCGAVTLFGDLKKLARLDEKTDKEQSRKE